MSAKAPRTETSAPKPRVWVTTIAIVGLVAALGAVFWAVIWLLSEPGRLQGFVWPAIVVVLGTGLVVQIWRGFRKPAP